MSRENLGQGIHQTGWKAWSVRTEFSLRKSDLWNVVQDNLADVKQYGIKYARNNNPDDENGRAKELIAVLVGPEEEGHIYNLKSAADAWVYLENKYLEIEQRRKLLLERRLGLLKAEYLRTGKPMSEWFNTAVGRFTRFQQNEGFMCSDKAFFKRVFKALPSDYNDTVATLEADQPLTMDKVRIALESYEKQSHRSSSQSSRIST